MGRAEEVMVRGRVMKGWGAHLARYGGKQKLRQPRVVEGVVGSMGMPLLSSPLLSSLLHLPSTLHPSEPSLLLLFFSPPILPASCIHASLFIGEEGETD